MLCKVTHCAGRVSANTMPAGHVHIKILSWHTCVIATVEAKVHSSSVGVVYVVRLHIVFSKAALQERGSTEPKEPPLDLPLTMLKTTPYHSMLNVHWN